MKELALTIGGYAINPPNSTIPTGGSSELTKIIGIAYELLLIVGILACLFMFIWGGFEWLISEGDKQRVTNARNRLALAVLGLMVIFGAALIVNLLTGFFLTPQAPARFGGY